MLASSLQYVGSLDVPRPNSRVEIVAAMRRIRVSGWRGAVRGQSPSIFTVSPVDGAGGIRVDGSTHCKPQIPLPLPSREAVLSCVVDLDLKAKVKMDVMAGGVLPPPPPSPGLLLLEPRCTYLEDMWGLMGTEREWRRTFVYSDFRENV